MWGGVGEVPWGHPGRSTFPEALPWAAGDTVLRLPPHGTGPQPAGGPARDLRSGMVLAKTKVAALQPTVCAAWLQAWMSMRYSVKWRRLEMTVRSRTTLSSRTRKSGWALAAAPVRLGVAASPRLAGGGVWAEAGPAALTATVSLRLFGILRQSGRSPRRGGGSRNKGSFDS